MLKMRLLALSAVLLFAGWPAGATAQQLTFVKDDYASVAGARAVVAGDFDRNGWPDIAQANTGRNTVTILLNHRGALTRSSDIAVGVGPFDISAGDFNSDGILDLAVANADDHSVSILIGRADGSFARLMDLQLADIGNPRGVKVADVNGDGKADLLISGYQAQAIVLYLGDGHAGFRRALAWFGYVTQPQGLAVADFNHDGRADAVTAADSSGGLVAQYGTGGPGVLAPPITVAGAQFLNVVSTGDLNGDGWPDVAAASTRSNQVAVFLGGSAGLTFSRSYTVGSSPRGLTIADINEDGMLDIVTADYASNTVSVLLGKPSAPGMFAAAMQVAANSGSRAVAAADFNQDGHLDLAAVNQNAAVATILSNSTIFGTRGFTFTRMRVGTASSSRGSDNDPSPVDFNRDGRLDVVTRAPGTTPGVLVLMNGGPAVTVLGPQPSRPAYQVADVTGDGVPDIVLENCPLDTGLDLITQISDGRGGFSASAHTTWPSISPCSVVVGEVNGDALNDLVITAFDWSTGGWVMRTMLGNGNGTFRAGGSAPINGTYPSHKVVAVADVNRDGRSDAVDVVYGRGLEIWFGNGAGGFSGLLELPMSLDVGSAVAVADLNHDGLPDIVASGSDRVAVLVNTGTGFDAPTYLSASDENGSLLGGLSRPALADVNVDGNIDIVTDRGAVFLGHGDGTFAAAALFDFGVSPSGVRVGDFNRDGLPDLILGAQFGSVDMLLNERNEVNHPPTVDARSDQTRNYQDQFTESVRLFASGSDPDAHALHFQWRDRDGRILSTNRFVDVPPMPPGAYTYTFTAFDSRGGSATDAMTLTIAPTREIVLYAAGNGEPFGAAWTDVSDPTAAGGTRLYNPNAGAPKVTTVSPNPVSYAVIPFIADPTQTYKLWIRMKADNNRFDNDSIWVQASGAATAAGTPAYRPGTASGLEVNLEECLGCGESGWGWEDDGWGAVNRNGTTLRFPGGGPQYIVIQQREDGVSIDQVVLSSEKYLTMRPGAAKNDHTILTRTYFPFPRP